MSMPTVDQIIALFPRITDLYTDAQIKEILSPEVPPMKSVVVTITQLDGGNTRAGAKAWVKKVDGVDSTKKDGYAIKGHFLNGTTHQLLEGTLLLFGGVGGSHKNSTSYYALGVVEQDANMERSSGYQSFGATNVKFVTSCCKTPSGKYPELCGLSEKYLTIAEAILDRMTNSIGSK